MKIGIIAVVGAMMFLIIGVFMYFPSRQMAKRLKNELSVVKNQIRQIERIFGKGDKMERSKKMLEARYQNVSSKFPKKEEEAMRMLSDIAKKFKTEVNSVSSRPKEFVFDGDGKKLEVQGEFCQKILVSMKIKANYKDLIEYIDALKETLPAYITIESLVIRKDTSGSLKLNVDLNLILYLLA